MSTVTYPELEGWEFVVAEVSAGVYKVRAEDSYGRIIERTGFDGDALLQRCRNDALEIQAGLRDRC